MEVQGMYTNLKVKQLDEEGACKYDTQGYDNL